MPKIWNDSPVAEVQAVVLRSILGNDRVACRQEEKITSDYRVFSYCEDFDYLWDLTGGLLDWLQTSQGTILLIWDETPREEKLGPVSVSDYLTAFDWAVALSLVYDEIGRAHV